ncbi:MAG: deoxyguanosinetriphosphate triphosphohydrolase, partial [Alphaproteobacteria bacterium]
PVEQKNILPTLHDFNSKWDLELNTFAGIEAQVAAIADDIAYNTHDIDDGHRAGLFRLEDLRELPLFGAALAGMEMRYPNTTKERLMHETVREVIGLMVTDLLETTRANIQKLQPKSAVDIRQAPEAVVSFSFNMVQNVNVLRGFLNSRMYRHSKVNRICAKAQIIVKDLFNFFMKEPACMPNAWFEAVRASGGNDKIKARLVADYIAGMTDRYAVQEHRKLFSTETML